MNILFVVEKRNTPNYLCIEKIAKACSKKGHNSFILSQGYERESFYRDNIEVKEFAVRPDFATDILNKLTIIKLKKIGQLIYKIFILLYTPMWPQRAPLYIRRLTKRVNKIVQEEKIDVVVLTHVSVENLFVAQRRVPNVIYIGYFLDLLVGGMKLSYMNEKIADKKARATEKKVMSYLDYAVMMDSSKALYQRKKYNYTDKLVFLDLPMLSTEVDIQSNSELILQFKDNIVLMFVGSMAKNIRNPQYILELFTRVKNSKARFVIVGNSDYYDVIRKYGEMDNRIVYLGRKSHRESLALMQEADFLINIGNDLKNMVPSKIFEYMSFRKPIITTYKVDDDPCETPLQKYGLFLSIDERVDIEQNVSVLENFIEDKKEYDELYFGQIVKKGGALYNNTPEAFVEFIESLKRGGVN